MAEAQQTPVIVDEEDEQKALSEQNLERGKTVGEMVEAGEVALPKSEGTVEDLPTTEEGVPRLDITPVKLKPKPEAGTGTQVRVVKDLPSSVLPEFLDKAIRPVSGVGIQFKSLREEAAASVQEKEPLTYENVLEKLDAGDTVSIQTGNGETQVYEGPVSAKLARNPAVKKEIELQLAIQDSLAKKKQQETGKFEPVLPFTGPLGDIDVSSIKDPEMRDMAEEYAIGRKALDDTLRPLVNTGRPDIDAAVRQYFVDDFLTGDMFSNLATRLAETGRAIPTLPTYAADLAGSAVEAIRRAYDMQTSYFDEWAALAPKRQQQTKKALQSIADVLPAPTAAMAFNDSIRERAKKEMSDEQYEDFAFITDTVTGEKVEREFISDEAAYEIIEEAFNQMNMVESFGVIFAENILGGGILTKTKNRAALDYVAQIKGRAKMMGIADDIPVEQLPAIIRKQDKSFKLNEKLFDLGIYNKGLNQQMSDAKDRIDDLGKQMEAIALRPNGRESFAYAKLESERNNLIRLRRRNHVKTRISPYMATIVKEEGGLALTAALGRELLPGAFGMNPDIAEMTGFIGGLITGKFTVPAAKFVGRQVGKITGITGQGLAAITPDGLLNPTTAIFHKLTNADLTVQDYEKLYYEPRYGRKMNYKERRALRGAFKQVERMDVETQEEFLNQLQQQQNFLDGVLDIFPEGPQRDRAEEMLDMSFAEASGLPQAIAAYQISTETMTMKGFRKGGMTGALEAAKAVDAKRLRTAAMIDAFEEHVAEFGNPSQTQVVTDLIQQTRKSLLNIEDMMNQEFIKLSKNLDSMMDEAVSDISTPLEETFLYDYAEAREFLARRVGTEESQELTEAAQTVEELRDALIKTNDSLLERFDGVRSVRNNRQLHSSALESAVEGVLFQRYGYLSKEMDEAYNTFRKFQAEREVVPKIDISPFVDDMLSLAAADEKNITTFFGPTSTFFSGFLGRKSRTMFEAMTRRTLEELGQEELQEMMVSIVDSSKGRLELQDIEAMMINEPVQFGLFLHQNGKLNVFANSTIEEAEEFRRAFRDYGHKTSNKAVAREYKTAEKRLNKLLEESDGEGYQELVKAREKYTQLNDPLREGSPMNKLMRSKVGDKFTADSGPYSGMFKGATPYDIVKGMGNNIAKAMKGGRDKDEALRNLRTKEIPAMEQLFGTVGDDGKMRIDLRTKEGRQALDLLEEITEAVIYDAWAADFLNKQPAAGVRLGDPRGIGFKQSVINELEEISQTFQINVIDMEGNNDKALVANLTSLIAEEKDIAKQIKNGGRLFEQGKRAVAKLKTEIKEKSSVVQARQKKELKAMQGLQSITKLQEPMAFYSEYISGYGDVTELRNMFMREMPRDPDLKDLTPEELGKLFDNAVYNMVYQGIIQIGGYGPKAKLATRQAVQSGLLGENITTSEFGNVLGAIAELENPQVLNNLQKIMPAEQITSLKNILSYLANQETVRIASDAAAKGMSAASALSRAYNIARGMVSPLYVTSEVTLLLATKLDADALLLALQNKDAAKIIEKILMYPKLVTPKELATFDTLITEFVVTDIIRKGQQEATLAYFEDYEEANNEQE